MNSVDPTYFDQQIYALYRAVWERWGDEAWYVVWRSGEVLFEEIEHVSPQASPGVPLSESDRLPDGARFFVRPETQPGQ